MSRGADEPIALAPNKATEADADAKHATPSIWDPILGCVTAQIETRFPCGWLGNGPAGALARPSHRDLLELGWTVLDASYNDARGNNIVEYTLTHEKVTMQRVLLDLTAAYQVGRGQVTRLGFEFSANFAEPESGAETDDDLTW